MRSCPRHSRTLAKCLAPSRGHSKTTPQRSAGRAVRSTELVPFSTSDEWYSRHRPVWFRLRRVRKRLAVTTVQPLADARGSYAAGALLLFYVDLGPAGECRGLVIQENNPARFGEREITGQSAVVDLISLKDLAIV